MDPQRWAGREDEAIRVVPRIAEILYRLRSEREAA